MASTEYCVFNETRSSCLISRVTVIDAQAEPLKAVKALIEGLTPNTSSALWLNPLKSVPTVPRLSPYDLVYLDQEGRVIHSVELVPDDEAPRFVGSAASALVLPLHSFRASRTNPGDRFILRPSAEFSGMASSASPLQARLPVENDIPEPRPGRARHSASIANGVLPDDSRETPLLSSALSAASQALLPFDKSLPAPPSVPAKKLLDVALLRSIARLRIGIQLSITVEPAAAQSAAPDASHAPAKSNLAPLVRLGKRLRQAAALLTDRCTFFRTVTLPIFFEHTLPTAGERVRGDLKGAYCSWKAAYAQWADGFFYGSRPGAVDRSGSDRPVRRPPVSVRHPEPGQDPARQLLHPPS